MAKIFLVTRERSETITSLAESLETDQQPIYLHLTYEPSVRNLLIIWASFLRIKPDLIYFVWEDEDLNWMEKAVVESIGALPYQPMAVSFMGTLDHKKSRSLQGLLKRADLVTLASRQNLANLRGLTSTSKRQLRTLLPPLFSLESLENETDHKSDEVLKAVGNKKIWISPWNAEYVKENQSFFEGVAKEHNWIFLSDRSDWKFHEHQNVQEISEAWKNKPLWSSELNKTEILKVLKQADVLLLAGQNLKPKYFVELASLAALSGTFVILDDHQIELMSGLWAVDENCSLVDRDFYSQQLENRWISKALTPDQIKRKSRPPSLALDQSLNDLNRWIRKALSDRKQA